jgi:hypothetical protein
MKRTRLSSPNHGTGKKVACTVSAAALMLGVSQAATVGLHFQLNYCGNGQYSGFPVSLTAFGIPPSGWENLQMMQAGYCPGDLLFYTLNQVVDTTTSTGGLNPLPNGSLNVTWSSAQANFSGFGSYAAKALMGNYGYDGPPPGPPNSPIPNGEWQVYSTFLRDGVTFGNGSNNGDNNQPGYTVDITGLKSLFTNSPFAIQLIAASDSMQYLTNAFIIDATLNSTQSVTYPSTAFPFRDEGGNGGQWYRGHGGGLSTASGSLNTDHVKIIGNRAAHGPGGAQGFDNASTISGFIITDKPVISMSPQPVLVCGGDTITWSGYAVGVPPLAYQWRKDGVAIPGATASSLTIANLSQGQGGAYDLRVTNLYGSAISAPVGTDKILTTKISNLVLDSNPQGPEHDGLNNGASWVASSTDGASVTRAGVMSFATNVPNQIVVPPDGSLNSSTGTISFWMRTSGVEAGGVPAALFDRLNASGGGVIALQANGTILFEASAGVAGSAVVVTTNVLSDNRWHQVAVVYDGSPSGPFNGAMSIYVDGQFDSSSFTGNDWSWGVTQQIELGLSHDTNTWQAYQGLVDDVRIYKRVLSGAEIASLHSGAIVDANALVMQLNFTSAPGQGITLRWQCGDAVLQSADSVTGPYTDVTGAASPYSVSVLKSAKYYRYRGHTAVTVVSNPYLM